MQIVLLYDVKQFGMFVWGGSKRGPSVGVGVGPPVRVVRFTV